MTEQSIIDEWQERLTVARTAMRSAPRTRRALIEVAAQHPLDARSGPGYEFRARLDRAMEITRQLQSGGLSVSIYVPGSRHRDKATGLVDSVSLSSAGVEYLRTKLSDPSVELHGDDLNELYKHDEGVYCGADECFVTAHYFRDGEFEQLHAVLSPSQLPRKALQYIAFGVEPLLHTAPVSEPFHGLIWELTVGVPRTLNEDATNQNTALAREYREERRVPQSQQIPTVSKHGDTRE